MRDKGAAAVGLAPAEPGADLGWSSLAGTTGNGEAPSLAFYLYLLRQRRWHIATFVLLATVAAVLIALSLPREYMAVSDIRVDPSGSQPLGAQSQPGANDVAVSGLELMATEANVITSTDVVLDVIRKNHLDQVKEFNPDYRAGAPSGEPSDEVVSRVTQGISVSQPLNTFILDVGFRARSPVLAANVANSLIQSFMTHEYQSRSQALQDSSRYMQAQLATLRSEMEDSQRALVDYESRSNVTNPDDRTNIIEARLSQLSDAHNQAQIARVKLEADYQIARSGSQDALLASDRGAALAPLHSQLLRDERELARLGQVYGARYPLYLQQQAVVAGDQRMLDQQGAHIAAQVESEYATSLGRERLLAELLASQKQQVDAFNLKTITYHSLKAESDSYTDLYNRLLQRIQDATVAAGLHSEDLRLISVARPPARAVFPRPLLTGGLALLLFTALGCGVALVLGVLDRTVRKADQVEHWFGVTVAGALPHVSQRDKAALSPVTYLDEGGGGAESEQRQAPFREAVLSLYSGLRMAASDRMPVLAIASSLPGEGKSTVTANMATAFAALGGSTVLVDVDLRRSSVHQLFRVSNRVGLSTVLRGQCRLEDALVACPGVANLELLPAGPAAMIASQLLHRGLEEILAGLQTRFDNVLLDCPPLLGFADALAACSVASGCLLVVRAGVSQRPAVQAALRQLNSVHASLLGIVLNDTDPGTDDAYGYYNENYYSSGRGTEQGDGDLD